MRAFLIAVLQNIFLYLVLSVSIFGWANLLTSILRFKHENKSLISLKLWLGWCATLLVFQILHLFFPLNAYLSGLIYTIGILLAGNHLINSVKIIRQNHKLTKKLVAGLSFWLLLMVWITCRSMLAPTSYDTGLYHLNSIRWINSYRIIPGLGNLHGRLAFNQSFFTFVAALNFYPLLNQGRTIANSFLYLLTLATLVEFLIPVFKNPSTLVKSCPLRFLPSIFTLPFMGYLAFSSDGFASPSPDFASILLQVILFVILLRWISYIRQGQKDLFLFTSTLTILATTSITIKLSNLIFAATILFLVIGFQFKKIRLSSCEIIQFLLLPFLISMIWILRGYLLSGAPFYPSMIGYLHFDWAVPPSWVEGEAQWIYSWARQPNKMWFEVLGNYQWFKPWLSRTFDNFTGVAYPMYLSALFFILNILTNSFIKVKRGQFDGRLILLPVISALIFWFFSAPDPRFANALFYLLPLSMIMVFFTLVHKITSSQKSSLVLLCAIFLVGNFHYFRYMILKAETITDISVTGYSPIKEISYIKKETESHLTVMLPESGDQCWDGQLLCTPYFSPSLRLRNPADITAGLQK